MRGDNSARVDMYRRDPGAPFDNWEREEYSKARAKGATMKASATLAGITIPTATKFERHHEIKLRIRELRDGAENFVGVSTAWVLQQLKINVDAARAENAFKSSNEALALIHKIITQDPKVGHQLARSLPPTVSPKELQARLRESFGEPQKPRRKKLVETAQPIDVPAAQTEESEAAQ